jgi:hypothetical protein
VTTNDDERQPNRARLRRLIGAVVLLTVPLAVVWWPGCRQYPPVTSREALKVVQLLNSASNTKVPKRLADAERRLADLDRQGKLSPGEKAGFENIVGLAKAGKWEDAERAAFQFAQDQVGQGDDDPDRHHDHDHHKHPHPKTGKSTK